MATKSEWRWKRDRVAVGESWSAKCGPITLDIWDDGDNGTWLWAVDVAGGSKNDGGYLSLYGKPAATRETAMQRAETRALKFVLEIVAAVKRLAKTRNPKPKTSAKKKPLKRMPAKK